MKLVMKIGGTLAQDAEALSLLVLQAGAIVRAGHRVLVVHGGGAQLNAFLRAAGIQPQFVEGRRVTSPAVLDAAVKVMAGSVNHELLAAFAAAGVPAAGISGVDGACLLAARADGAGPDLGLVGRIELVRTELFDALAERGFVPLVAPLAVTSGGQILNVNADEVAVACAAGWRADRLVFLTDVEGVRDAEGRVLAELMPAAIEQLIEGGIATGGMLAKLRAAAVAVAQGVPQVRIAGGREPRVLRRLLDEEPVGTAVRSAPAASGAPLAPGGVHA